MQGNLNLFILLIINPTVEYLNVTCVVFYGMNFISYRSLFSISQKEIWIFRFVDGTVRGKRFNDTYDA